jgi:two-component system chemotaxis sensor kinase CheA
VAKKQMQSIDKLTGLIDQAASAINMTSATDLSEIDSLRPVLEQIRQIITVADDAPARLLEQADNTASEAAQAIQDILRKESQDTDSSIQIISEAIATLQKLTDEIRRGKDAGRADPAPAEHPQDTDISPQPGDDVSDEKPGFLRDFINEASEHIGAAEEALVKLENEPDNKDLINQLFCGVHMIKGLAGFLNLTQIYQLAHWTENLLGLANRGELKMTGGNIETVLESIDMMKKLLAGLENPTGKDEAVSEERCSSPLLEKLKEATGNRDSASCAEASATDDNDRQTDKQKDKSSSAKDDSNKQQASAQTQILSADEKIKVSTARLDNLINMVGELVVAQLMVSEEVNTKQASQHNLCRKIAHQSKIIREIQKLSMSIRMVPIGGVFQKMARLVRDLSRKSSKEIDFVTTGNETELDRTVVDKISDPLVHMIRNAIDHGIEPPEERKKKGKNPKGRIELRAYHEAENIVIEIEDDGKGLNKKRILEKAVENGIVTEDHKLSGEEILKLVFHAGLSTAREVTSVSGRGVGMDVVKKSVESLHGKIDINSTLGKGSTFTIRMPLTLAIIDGQIIRIADNRYVIPINSIDRSLRPTTEQLSSVQGRGEMAMVQGRLRPLIRLHKLFAVVPDTEDPTESLLVVVEDNGNKCCLLVDELLGQQQVVIKSLGEGMGKVKGIAGGAIMGDGRVSLILDIPGLMELARRT